VRSSPTSCGIRRLLSTANYTKADIEALRVLARPWQSNDD
jgi:hypothetical protein